MSTLINPRGTSGSGKTTLARALMALYVPGGVQAVYRDGRKRPIYTLHHRLVDPAQHPSLMVLGHYEAACGGCDTITVLDDVFELVRLGIREGHDVLFEGLILSGEIKRTEELCAEHEVHIIALTTPVDQCVANINKRREARGQMEPVRPKNTVSKARCVELTMNRLRGKPGVTEYTLDYDAAFATARALLHA